MLEDNGGYHVFVTYCSVICGRAEMSLVSQDMELTVGLDFRRALPAATGTLTVWLDIQRTSAQQPV